MSIFEQAQEYLYHHGYNCCNETFEDFLQQIRNGSAEEEGIPIDNNNYPEKSYVREQAGAMDGEIFGFGPWQAYLDVSEEEESVLDYIVSELSIDDIYKYIGIGADAFINEKYK